MDDCQLEEYKISRHKLAANKSFPCNKCLFTASSAYILIKHKKTEHVNEYPCDLCDFVATSEELLEKHKVNNMFSLFWIRINLVFRWFVKSALGANT